MKTPHNTTPRIGGVQGQMQSKIAAIDKAKDIQTLWALTLEGLAESGIDHVIYLTVNSDFSAPFTLTNRPDIYTTLQPQDDPFLAHCCRSYTISFTGYEFLSEHAYLPDTAKDFIKDAAAHGFFSGLGIPMRLEGSLACRAPSSMTGSPPKPKPCGFSA